MIFPVTVPPSIGFSETSTCLPGREASPHPTALGSVRRFFFEAVLGSSNNGYNGVIMVIMVMMAMMAIRTIITIRTITLW